MTKKTESRYSLQPSTAYIMTFLVIELIFYLIVFLIAFYVIKDISLQSIDNEKFSKIFWSSYLGLSFITFAITFASINSYRYWVDTNFIEILNIYRPKKKKSIKLDDLTGLEIRRIPLLSDAFNYGTILFISKNKKNKKKIIGKIIGIRFYNEIYLDLVSKMDLKIDERKKTLEEI